MGVRLYLDARASDGKEAPMKASVSINKRTTLIPLGVRIQPCQWDKKKREVIDHPRRKELNRLLVRKKSDLEMELLRLEERGKLRGASISRVRELLVEFLNPGANIDDSSRFVYRFERFISLKDAPKTIKGYRWTLKALREFDPRLDSRCFDDISVDYLKEFVSYCKHHGLNQNSCNIHLRYIRAVFNDAIAAGVTSVYPFRSLAVKPLPVRKKALSRGQLCNLFAFPVEPWQEEYRDMFKLMLFLRGINAVDLFSARLSQVVNGRLEYRRSKVGTLFSVKIEPEAQKIIDRYKGKDYLLSPLDRYSDYEDYLHHMNDALKAIGRPLGKAGKVLGDGFFPQLSSNWARHSWASIGALLDIPKDTISRGLGHSFGVPVTDVYIDFDMKKVDEANRWIIDYVLYGKDYRNIRNPTHG